MLPLKSRGANGAMDAQGLAATAAQICVVLIDSEADVRRAGQLQLRAGGFDVRAFASGNIMLANFGNLHIGCVVMRDEMIDLGGFELLRHLRERRWHGPAILLTRLVSTELAESAADAGFAALLDRPLVDDLMLQAVNAAVRKFPNDIA